MRYENQRPIHPGTYGYGYQYGSSKPRGPVPGATWIGESNPAVKETYKVQDSVGTLAAAEYVDTNCLSLDGTQFFDSGACYGGGQVIRRELYVRLDASSEAFAYVFANTAEPTDEGVVGIIRRNLNADVQLYLRPNGAPSNQNVILNGNVFDGTWKRILIEYDTGAVSASIEDLATGAISTTTASITPYNGFTDTDTIRIGAKKNGTQRSVGDIALIDFGTCFKYPCVHNPPLDVSGNGNHATSSTATLTTGNTIPAHNIEKGYSPTLYSDATNQRVIGPAIAGAVIYEGAFRTYNQTTLNQTLLAYDSPVANSFHTPTVLHNFNGCVSVYFNGSADGYRTPNDSILYDEYYEVVVNSVDETISINGVDQVLTGGAPNFTHNQGETVWLHERGGVTPNYFNGEQYYHRLKDINGNILFEVYPLGGGVWYETVTDQVLPMSIGTLEDRYIPAVVEKTSAVWTSTGPGDELYGPSLDETETITNDGTAVLGHNGVGGIRATTYGTAYNIRIDGELVYPITELLGKRTTDIPSVSSKYPQAATVFTGAAGLDGAWGTRIPDAAGVVVDAKDYMPIKRLWQKHHNFAESGIKQTDVFFSSGTQNFFSDLTGTIIETRYAADLLDHYKTNNGGFNLWVKREDIYGPDGDKYAYITQAYQYPLDKVFTAEETARNQAYFGS